MDHDGFLVGSYSIVPGTIQAVRAQAAAPHRGVSLARGVRVRSGKGGGRGRARASVRRRRTGGADGMSGVLEDEAVGVGALLGTDNATWRNEKHEKHAD